MARRSLKPQLNQIRTWVRQGRTDAWIAHQLDVTVQQVSGFKQEYELAADGEPDAAGADFGESVDLRAEDDALIAAALEEEAARREQEAAERAENGGDDGEGDADGADGADDEDGEPRARRRGRRGGRGRGRRAKTPASYEGTFDHGDEGYGLWLDPAVADDPLYAEHWSGNREVEVTVEADRIVIRRAGESADDGD